MTRVTIALPLVLLLAACGPTRQGQRSPAPTVKRTTGSDPRFLENISMTPGAEGPGANGAPNTGRLTGPGYTSNIASFNIENGTELQFKYAVLMNENVESLNNLGLLQFIDDWYGTRYRYGGSTKAGIDCSAFTCQLSSAVFGKTLPRIARDQFEQCQKISTQYLQTGDLVFFNTRGGVSHVGIYLLNNKFVHASTSNGVVISDLNESYYKNRFLGAGRY